MHLLYLYKAQTLVLMLQNNMQHFHAADHHKHYEIIRTMNELLFIQIWYSKDDAQDDVCNNTGIN